MYFFFILAENIVITAAHCMYGAYSVIMYMASHDIIHGNDAEVWRNSIYVLTDGGINNNLRLGSTPSVLP